METTNDITKGIHSDNNSYRQPNSTMVYNRNGISFDSVSGNYIWKNLNGTKQILALSLNDKIMKDVSIRDRFFILVLNTVSNYVKLIELSFDSAGEITGQTLVWQSTNTLMNLSVDHPIRSMFGIYENNEIQRIYFNDFYNQPRVLNIGNTVPVTLNDKFIDLVPLLSGCYGTFDFVQELSGGSLPAGTYFFAWRLYADNYYTDWSYLSKPVGVFNGSPGATYKAYHEVQGDAPNHETTKGIQFKINGIDTDYTIIQIAAFYSNDYNSVSSGKLIIEKEISEALMTFDYYGNENFGSVTISELLETSIVITKCKDMIVADKYNIVANLQERAEIDVRELNSLGKHDRIDVSIIPNQYGIILDSRTYTDTFTEETIPLCGTISTESLYPVELFCGGIWFKAITETSYSDNDPTETIVIPAGEYFKPSLLASFISGTFVPVIIKKKYLKGNAVAPYDINSSYELETDLISTGYYNYKNPLFVEKLKGYPAGEKIRFGILFLDKTGRPFFVRHLYNTETIINGLQIGPGDTRVPERSEGLFNIATPFEPVYDGEFLRYFRKLVGHVNYFTISGIDITDIKDQIGAFMIVRCPIEHENIAYGILGLTHTKSGEPNNVYINEAYINFANDAYRFAKTYAFHSPEDLLDFSEFSIQPGDKLENKYYMVPFYADEISSPGFQGFGKHVDVYPGHDHYYQKFYSTDISARSGNAAIGVEHEIQFTTRYTQGDGNNIPINPTDETKLLRNNYQIGYESTIYYSYLTNVNILVLDIDETGNDIKGDFNLSSSTPKQLVCSVKRPISNPYGGITDNSLASSVYISTGHYQVVNDTVLAAILNNNAYVFNDIDVFGGDVYVGIWDFLRTQGNEDLDGAVARYGHAILTPIESRINLDMREGNHVGKNRIYNPATNTNGLRWLTGSNKWEEFNYNDGYSTDNINDYYLAVPQNFSLQNEFDTTFRYSNEKAYGQFEDAFRKFKPLNKYVLDTKFGPINNIRYKFRNLIYWQSKCIGYVPVGERALMSNDVGNVIQLGISGLFERNDQLVEFVGNSNQFGLVESSDGFHWYDAIKKMVITLTNSMKLTPESIIKGLDNFLVNTIPNNMDQYDNPVFSYGITGGYDPRIKMVYITFRTATILETIAINMKTGFFEGFYSFNPSLYFSFRDFLYASDSSSRYCHQFGTGVVGTYFGVQQDRYFSIIVKGDSDIAKIFDTWEIIGNDKFFSSVKYELEDGSYINEELSGANAVHVSQKIDYRNKRWVGNFPKISRKRLTGGYCKITFYNTGTNNAMFNTMKTIFRETI